MKRKFIYISLIVFVIALGIGSSLYLDLNTDQEDIALNHVYKSLDEIYEDSHLIVRAEIPDYYVENDVKAGDGITFIEKIYDIEIERVYENKTEFNIQKKDSIKLTQSSNLKLDNNGDIVIYPTTNISELEQGTYLLFLKTHYDETKGEIVFYPAPENIYKLDKNNRYKNIASHHLSEIDEFKLEEKVKKNQ